MAEAYERMRRKAEGQFSDRNKQNQRGGDATEEARSAPPPYTPEQLKQVEKAKQCQDFYELLGVSRDCSDEDLKKAYKKMALKFHPDKNKAPGSTEVFKAVSNAYTVLSKPEKRRHYDTYGSTTVNNARPQSASPFTYMNEEDNVSPEELFAQFFGNMALHSMGLGTPFNTFGFNGIRVFSTGSFRGFGPGMRRRTFAERRQQNAAQRPQRNNMIMLQLLPIFLFVLLSLVSSWLQSDPPYSFVKNSQYAFSRSTKLCGIKYFVQSDFGNKYYGSNLRKLEVNIESNFLKKTQNQCYNELRTKEHLRLNAMMWGNEKSKKAAEARPTPSCDEYNRLKRIIESNGA